MNKFSIKNMSVKLKVAVFSAVMLIFMVVIAGVGLFAANTVNKSRRAHYDNYAMTEYNLAQSLFEFADIKANVNNMPIMYYAPGVTLDFAGEVAKVRNGEAAMKEYLTVVSDKISVFKDKNISKKFTELTTALTAWMENTEENIALFQQGKNSANRADYDKDKIDEGCHDLMTDGGKIAEQADTVFQELIALIEAEADSHGEEVERGLTILIAILVVVAVIAFIIAFAYAIHLIRLITTPVNVLSEAAKKMAVGDVDVECTKIADDDLGMLVDNFAHMVAAVKEQAGIAQQLSTGDMTVKVTPRGEKDILGRALKKLADDQNRTLSNVKESTMQVTVGAEQVAMASQSLAQGATEQASALEQVTVSVDDIAQRTKVNAAEANKANELVHSVKKTAVEGNQQMKAMKEAMDEINKTSEDISKIIKVIDEIAFQTNILALNAAVEAARAGTHGKGFSVVAEEVRNLAGRCQSAAGETAEMIENSIRKIHHGSELANETEKSLEAIGSSIDEVVSLVVSIAEASNNQATAIAQIDQAMGQVSQVVQTNSATSEECAAASEELSNQAANLRKMMANFKLSAGKSGSISSDTDLGFGAGYSNNDQIISLDGGEFGKY